MAFADVILPVPVPRTYTYLIPDDVSVQVGSRVIVQFGPKKIYTGLVANVKDDHVSVEKAKDILEVLDTEPIVNSLQIGFFGWLANYYLCTMGEVMNAAIPAGLKLSSESYVHINQEVEWLDQPQNEREDLLLEHLAYKEMSVKEVGDLLALKRPQTLIKSLADRKMVHLYEKVKDKYSPKTEKRVRLADTYTKELNLEELFDDLEKKPKQVDVLLAYLQRVPATESEKANRTGISRSQLSQHCSLSSIKTLTKLGILEEWEETVSRLPPLDTSGITTPKLSDLQQLTYREVEQVFEKKNTALLRGITGSGKTEIYISLIQQKLDQGLQVLYLLPEIALTTQIIQRLRKSFGNAFGVYHSQYSDNERVEVWQKVLKGEYNFVVGVRSSVFLPFDHLGLIIVDEEHEHSYKQYEPAPRYHARDAAIYLAGLHGAKTLLGSATPAVETFAKALEGKFGLVELETRFGDVKLPKVELIDLKMARKRREMRANIFTVQMLEAIGSALEQKEQVILFQNRRGYAPHLLCEDCGHVMQCQNCDVSMTYHQLQNLLMCHYCGFKMYPPQQCPECGLNHIKHSGYGTEQLEDELQPFFPDAKIQRMDLDTTRTKNSYQRILGDFENGKIDILVGTQMVSKGLDFDRVNLVGIFDIDRIIHFPDFRSHERAYQLITQVSGRAGRKSGTGKVLIQTFDPGHVVLQKVLKDNYRTFYQREIQEREQYHYPPFARMVKITIRHKDAKAANDAALHMAAYLRQLINERAVDGPSEPMINRVRNKYLKDIHVKLGLNISHINEIKQRMLVARDDVQAHKDYRSVQVVFDVDPL